MERSGADRRASPCCPGDVVIGDSSGLLFFPPQLAEEALKGAQDTVYTETFKREMIQSRQVPDERDLSAAEPGDGEAVRGMEEDAPASLDRAVRHDVRVSGARSREDVMRIAGRFLAGTWALTGLLGIAAGPSFAQVTTGTITGTVKDAAGAVVPGATVTVTETDKQTSSTYVTDADGSYNAPFLIPGTYEIAVEVQGFSKHLRRGVVLQVNQRARIDVALELGTFAETTEVTALAPLTRSDSAEMGEVIEERAVRELPLNGRNFATLVYLTPGVTAGQVGENLSGASTFNPRGAANFNALGSQANANAWLIDGIDNNEFTFNTVIVTPSVESVREFKVLTGTFSAEFGRGAGVVSVSTKSGNNEIHGTAFEYLRNEKFDARNFFALPTAKKPPLDRHQFGAALSGPIFQNQTFFFVDYAGLKEDARPDLREHGAHRKPRAAATSATTATPAGT